MYPEILPDPDPPKLKNSGSDRISDLTGRIRPNFGYDRLSDLTGFRILPDFGSYRIRIHNLVKATYATGIILSAGNDVLTVTVYTWEYPD
jgi:hypothetical protein